MAFGGKKASEFPVSLIRICSDPGLCSLSPSRTQFQLPLLCQRPRAPNQPASEELLPSKGESQGWLCHWMLPHPTLCPLLGTASLFWLTIEGKKQCCVVRLGFPVAVEPLKEEIISSKLMLGLFPAHHIPAAPLALREELEGAQHSGKSSYFRGSDLPKCSWWQRKLIWEGVTRRM